MDPNWRHIIPPNQDRVISEGHCIEDCTRRALPRTGVNVFATMMRTHQIGKEVQLRHIRNNVEFPAITADRNIDPNYQEFRRLSQTVRVQPGDRLIAECIYDSSTRDQITLGKAYACEMRCVTAKQVHLIACKCTGAAREINSQNRFAFSHILCVFVNRCIFKDQWDVSDACFRSSEYAGVCVCAKRTNRAPADRPSDFFLSI